MRMAFLPRAQVRGPFFGTAFLFLQPGVPSSLGLFSDPSPPLLSGPVYSLATLAQHHSAAQLRAAAPTSGCSNCAVRSHSPRIRCECCKTLRRSLCQSFSLLHSLCLFFFFLLVFPLPSLRPVFLEVWSWYARHQSLQVYLEELKAAHWLSIVRVACHGSGICIFKRGKDSVATYSLITIIIDFETAWGWPVCPSHLCIFNTYFGMQQHLIILSELIVLNMEMTCILQPCFIHLLVTRGFLFHLWDFSKHYHNVWKQSFISYFPVCIIFFFFSCHVALARTSSVMLNRREDIPARFSVSGEKYLVSRHEVWRGRFSLDVPHHVEEVPFYF